MQRDYFCHVKHSCIVNNVIHSSQKPNISRRLFEGCHGDTKGYSQKNHPKIIILEYISNFCYIMYIYRILCITSFLTQSEFHLYLQQNDNDIFKHLKCYLAKPMYHTSFVEDICLIVPLSLPFCLQ